MPLSIKQLPLWINTFFLLLLGSPLMAQSEAHVHGLANLMIVLEGDEIEIGFESPAMNLLGFEHVATTDDEIQLVEKAEQILESPSTLFSFSGSSCELQNMTLDLSGVMDEEHHDEHEEHHESHGTADTHDEHEEHADEDAHHDAHEGHEGHSEIVANYHFDCDDIARISSISVALFDHFPGLENINAMWITESRQGAETLSNGHINIPLR